MEANKKLTAVEWLFEQIPFEVSSSRAAFEAKQIAKQMEKEQHGDTWGKAIQAHEDRGHVFAKSLCDFDDHYNETYGTNE